MWITKSTSTLQISNPAVFPASLKAATDAREPAGDGDRELLAGLLHTSLARSTATSGNTKNFISETYINRYASCTLSKQ